MKSKLESEKVSSPSDLAPQCSLSFLLLSTWSPIFHGPLHKAWSSDSTVVLGQACFFMGFDSQQKRMKTAGPVEGSPQNWHSADLAVFYCSKQSQDLLRFKGVEQQTLSLCGGGTKPLQKSTLMRHSVVIFGKCHTWCLRHGKQLSYFLFIFQVVFSNPSKPLERVFLLCFRHCSSFFLFHKHLLSFH